MNKCILEIEGSYEVDGENIIFSFPDISCMSKVKIIEG